MSKLPKLHRDVISQISQVYILTINSMLCVKSSVADPVKLFSDPDPTYVNLLINFEQTKFVCRAFLT